MDVWRGIGSVSTAGIGLSRKWPSYVPFHYPFRSRLSAVPEGNRLQIEKTAFSPVELVEDVRLLFSHQALTRGLSLSVDVDKALPSSLLGDGGRIRQILLNLVGNALKFTVFGGIAITARVGGASGEQRIELIVDDTGPEFPPNKLLTIFDPFTQADSSNARRLGGVGLGLAISSRLAQLMGGNYPVRICLSERALPSPCLLRLPTPPGATRMCPVSCPPRGMGVGRHESPGGRR